MSEEKFVPEGMGERVRDLRLELDMTQEELAEQAEMQRTQLSKIEMGRCATSMRTLMNLCDALSTTSDWLLFGDR